MSDVPVITKKQFIAGAVCPACSEAGQVEDVDRGQRAASRMRGLRLYRHLE